MLLSNSHISYNYNYYVISNIKKLPLPYLYFVKERPFLACYKKFLSKDILPILYISFSFKIFYISILSIIFYSLLVLTFQWNYVWRLNTFFQQLLFLFMRFEHSMTLINLRGNVKFFWKKTFQRNADL